MSQNWPHSREAERGLVGAALLSPDALEDSTVAAVLPADFHEQRLGPAWRAILELFAERQHVSPETTAMRLGERGPSEVELTLLTAEVGSALAAPEYARVVRRDALRREGMNRASGSSTMWRRRRTRSQSSPGLVAWRTLKPMEPWTSYLPTRFPQAWPAPCGGARLLPIGLTLLGERRRWGSHG
jgi:hypothetical protein